MKINGYTAYRCCWCCDRAVWIGGPDAGAWYCDVPEHDEAAPETVPATELVKYDDEY